MKDIQKITEDLEGPWFDCCRGIYIGVAVQQEAIYRGWKGMELRTDEEFYWEAVQEASDYLQQFAPEGYLFGGNGDCGCWGLFKEENFGQ